MGKHECKCERRLEPLLTYDILMPMLQNIRVGGLLLTANEADNIARRILLEQATAIVRKEAS